MKKLFFIPLFGSILFACNDGAKTTVAANQTINLDSAKQLINATNLKFGTAMAAGDSATITSLYHSEAQILAPNMPIMTSRNAIGAMARKIPQMGIKKFTLQTTELMNAGEYLTETGTYEMGDGSITFDKGKYIVLWKKEGDQWKLYRDIWNSDIPVPAPAK